MALEREGSLTSLHAAPTASRNVPFITLSRCAVKPMRRFVNFLFQGASDSRFDAEEKEEKSSPMLIDSSSRRSSWRRQNGMDGYA